MPEGEIVFRLPVPPERCMRWHGISLFLCECYQTGAGCPPCARRPLPKLTQAQVMEALALGARTDAAARSVNEKRASLAGDICADCGSPNVVWNGTCRLCRDCGSSSGGCS